MALSLITDKSQIDQFENSIFTDQSFIEKAEFYKKNQVPEIHYFMEDLLVQTSPVISFENHEPIDLNRIFKKKESGKLYMRGRTYVLDFGLTFPKITVLDYIPLIHIVDSTNPLVDNLDCESELSDYMINEFLECFFPKSDVLGYDLSEENIEDSFWDGVYNSIYLELERKSCSHPFEKNYAFYLSNYSESIQDLTSDFFKSKLEVRIQPHQENQALFDEKLLDPLGNLLCYEAGDILEEESDKLIDSARNEYEKQILEYQIYDLNRWIIPCMARDILALIPIQTRAELMSSDNLNEHMKNILTEYISKNIKDAVNFQIGCS